MRTLRPPLMTLGAGSFDDAGARPSLGEADEARTAERLLASKRRRHVMVLVPTTGGCARVGAIVPVSGAAQSYAALTGDFRKLPISGDYHQFVNHVLAPGTGVTGPFRLELSAAVDAGRSWELPVLVAHRAIALGLALTDDPAEADAVIFATGEVTSRLAAGAPPEGLPAKLAHAGSLLEAASSAGASVHLLTGSLPPPAQAALRASAAAVKGQVVDGRTLAQVDALLTGTDGAPTTRATTDAVPAPAPGRPRPVGGRGLAALALLAAAVVLAIGLGRSIIWDDPAPDTIDAMLNLTARFAADRDQCIEAHLTGTGFQEKALPIVDGAATVPDEGALCAIVLTSRMASPLTVGVDASLSDALLAPASPRQGPVELIGTRPYALVFREGPTAPTGSLRLTAGDGDPLAVTLHFSAADGSQ